MHAVVIDQTNKKQQTQIIESQKSMQSFNTNRRLNVFKAQIKEIKQNVLNNAFLVYRKYRNFDFFFVLFCLLSIQKKRDVFFLCCCMTKHQTKKNKN